MNTDRWDKLTMTGVALTVLLAPTQMGLRIPVGPARTFADIGVGPADILLALTALVWGLGALSRGKLKNLKWPPAAAWVFLALCVPAVFWSGSWKRGAAELVQYLEYFFVGYMVLVNVLVTRSRRMVVLYALLTGLAVNTGLAAKQYFGGTPVEEVAGALGNRNLLGMYFCLMAPMAAALDFFHRTVWLRLIGAILAVTPLAFILAGGPLAGLLIALGVVVSLKTFRALPIYLAAMLVMIVFLYPVMPRDNARALTQSVSVYDEAERDQGRQVSRRYLEWQATLKTLDPRQPAHTDEATYWRNVLLGTGLGVYEKEIGRFWGALPDPHENVMERDSQNQYAVIWVTSGLPAMLAFVWLLTTYARAGLRAWREREGTLDRALGVGVLAAVLAVGLAGMWTVVIARGVGLILVTLAAITQARDETVTDKRVPNE